MRSFAESEKDIPEKPAPATATILEKVMSKYTAEQVLYAAQLEEDTYDGDLIIVQYLRDYAAHLREREAIAPMAFKHPEAVRSTANFLLSKFEHARCDNEGVSCCIRCNAVAISRWALEALTLPHPPKGGEGEK